MLDSVECYRNCKTFVAHRVGEVMKKVILNNWVPTNKNPADDLTKDEKEVNKALTSRWFTGPCQGALAKGRHY